MVSILVILKVVMLAPIHFLCFVFLSAFNAHSSYNKYNSTNHN
jgi:hypothetical protein